MRTLRVMAVATSALVVLGASGSAVMAQMDADADAVYVTVETTPLESDAGTMSEVDALYSSRDGVGTYTNEASDPRVSGTSTIFWNVDVDRDTGQGIMWGTAHLENDGGTWEGPWTGMEYEPGDNDYFTTSGWLVGDGDYAGYTFYFQLDAFQYGGPVRMHHGIIFKGQPPVPEPPAE